MAARRASPSVEVTVARLVGAATAGTTPGALNFELQIKPAGGSTYYLQKRYRELTALQAELIKGNTLAKPVLIPASKSVGVDERRASVDELLRRLR